MIFTPIHHQFTLFDYNEMRQKIKVPIKRISKERMEQAIHSKPFVDWKAVEKLLEEKGYL